MEWIRIAVADDEELFRKGIILMLEKAGYYEIVFEAASCKTLIDLLDQQACLPDIILMDLKTPEMNGVEAYRIIKERFGTVKLIVLSSYCSEAHHFHMMCNGIVAVLNKNCAMETMLYTIRQVYEKGFFYSDNLLQYIKGILHPKRALGKPGKDILTKRELEIMILICRQLTTLEIAELLYISPRTVEGHRNNLLLKTGSKNTVSLVIYALEKKIVTIEDIKHSR